MGMLAAMGEQSETGMQDAVHASMVKRTGCSDALELER